MNTSLMLFLAGLLIGWLLEWVIDWFFWRRNTTRVYQDDIDLRAELDATKEQLADAKRGQAQAAALQRQLDSASAQLDALKQERTDLQHQLATCRDEVAQAAQARASARTASIDLDQRSDAPPAEAVAAMTGQAELDALRQERDALQQMLYAGRYAGATMLFVERDDLEQIEGIGPIYEERLYASGVETFAQLAQKEPDELAAIIGTGSRSQADFERWIVQAQAFAALLQTELLKDDLEEINGIGPVYAKRLRAAGITSFAALADCTTDKLADVVGKGRTADYESWIAQATVYAALVDGTRTASNLERIKGIGPVFAARLELAGVTTFAALSQLSEAELQQIIGNKGWGLVHHDRWIRQAQLLAEQELAE